MTKKTTVDANLFRLVWTTVSKEEVRYYLNGVSIEPHPEKGALLVATDGQRMLIAHDENGHCEERIIVALPAYALQQCKHKSVEQSSRVIEIDHEEATATISKTDYDGKVVQVLTTYGVLIDGTFVNWRKVIPDMSEASGKNMGVMFNTEYLKEFGALGREISKTLSGGEHGLLVQAKSTSDPAIIRWSGARHVFGVIMPMRFDERLLGVPEYVQIPAPEAAA
jgi:DNA polymerase-3 subunit beta